MNEYSSISNHESIEASTLRELRELTAYSDGSSQFGELINVFLKGLELDLALLYKALAEGNAEQLGRLAHGVKGASASMGAGYLASLCSDLERTSATAKPEEAEAQLKQIESEMGMVRKRLEKEISDESP